MVAGRRGRRSDTFVTLHLEDVDPATGQADEITSGWDSLSFRALDPGLSTPLGHAGLLPFHPDTRASVETLAPGQVYDWWIGSTLTRYHDPAHPSAIVVPVAG